MNLFQDWEGVLRVVVIGTLAYGALIAFVRLYGKRTLAKMNAFDFIVTVALGSALSGLLLNRGVPLIEGVTAFATLLTLQFAISWASVRSAAVRRAVKSEPALLVHHGRALPAALRRERVSLSEAEQAARQRGHQELAHVEALVLETDGSFSVIARSRASPQSD